MEVNCARSKFWVLKECVFLYLSAVEISCQKSKVFGSHSVEKKQCLFEQLFSCISVGSDCVPFMDSNKWQQDTYLQEHMNRF